MKVAMLAVLKPKCGSTCTQCAEIGSAERRR